MKSKRYKVFPEGLYIGGEYSEPRDNPDDDDDFIPDEWKFLKVETYLKRHKDWAPEKAPQLLHSKDMVKFVKMILERTGHSDRERLYSFFLDAKSRPIGIHLVTIGTSYNTPAPPGELFRAAILSGARQIVLIHNHPSGVADLSDGDKKMLDRMVEIGKIMDIPVVDFITIGFGGTIYSAYNHGLMG